jgi:hypothetical protein
MMVANNCTKHECVYDFRTYLIGWNFMRGNIWIDAFYKPQLHTLTQFYQKYPSWFKFTRSWSWSHGSWIYNYLYNQCLSPLKLWVRTPLMARCTRYNIMWSILSVICDRSVIFLGTLVSYTNKTDRHDVAEMLLKVALCPRYEKK